MLENVFLNLIKTAPFKTDAQLTGGKRPSFLLLAACMNENSTKPHTKLSELTRNSLLSVLQECVRVIFQHIFFEFQIKVDSMERRVFYILI